jgi:hypothetical protein
MSSDTERAIEEILNDFERQPLQDRRTFRAYLNQPELIALSSTNAQIQSPPISPLTYAQYYNFTVNLPRPALDAKSLQLLKAVIPQAQCSIPDYSLVFPYYKLRTLPIDSTGQLHYVDTPSFSNLYFIRLLPSYYKKELVGINNNENSYGYNQTFADYAELEVELKKACQTDLLIPDPHYIANDITISYERSINKFIFKGLNTDTENTYPEFDLTRSYFKNAVVSRLGITYLALQFVPANLNFPEVEPTYWLDTTQFFEDYPNFNSYLIAGFNDPLVAQLLEYVENVSTPFDIPTLASIPGNQNVSGQTLARRLGFTWDGTGMRTTNINSYYGTGIDFGGTLPLFYNRFRVVPGYQALDSPPPVELGSGLVYTNNFYTADGYCNLVYSSIINIYTTIVGTSSVDTQRNANLLAMIPLDCGNLGVAMVGNYIDNALTKIQGDIYSIYIELRDENGEPYYLTNNATTTLLIKLTY